MSLILVTGAAGFIGSRVAALLLDQAYQVAAIDNLNDYYDVKLKQHRLEGLKAIEEFTSIKLILKTMPIYSWFLICTVPLQ